MNRAQLDFGPIAQHWCSFIIFASATQLCGHSASEFLCSSPDTGTYFRRSAVKSCGDDNGELQPRGSN